MAIFRSRALTGSRQPRARGRMIRDVIQHHCLKCEVSYSVRRGYGAIEPGTFLVSQGHLQVTCPEGHSETIETTGEHLR